MAAKDARAANTCGAFLSLDNVPATSFLAVGDTGRVRIRFGTGVISGGTALTVSRVRYDLDCDASMPLGSPCTDEGAIVAYGGDATITTTCGTSFTTGHAAGAAPNQVVFTATPPMVIAAGTPDFCSLEFDVQILAPGTDSTPSQVEEVAGYTAADNDAQCDNGLRSSASQSLALPLCPTCDDSNECTIDVCNRDTGTCESMPGTSDADGDGEADATDRCPGTATGAPVDDAGCSQAQFCAGFDATTPDGARACKKADWRNDEPLMKRREADCVIDRGGKGHADDRCVPGP